MSNYDQNVSNGSVTTYNRCCRIELQSAYGQNPSATFFEELAILLPDGSFHSTPLGVLTESVSDMTQSFNLVSPTNQQVIGTMTYQQLYVAMYSLYYNLAQTRDAAAAAQAAATAAAQASSNSSGNTTSGAS